MLKFAFFISLDITTLEVNTLWPGDTIWRQGSRWHQAITWTNVDLSSLRSSDVHLREISLEISQPSITKISLKNHFSKILLKSPMAQWVNKWILGSSIWHPLATEGLSDWHRSQTQTWKKNRKFNRPWQKSNQFSRWSGYISMANFSQLLPCNLKKMPGNCKFDLFYPDSPP